MIRLVASVAVALVMVAATGARADEDRDAQAKRHFVVGRAAFEKHEYARALVEFRAAYALAPFPGLLYNIGRCHEELGDTDAAIDSFERYLEVAPPSDKPDIEQRLLRLRMLQDVNGGGRKPVAPRPPPPAKDAPLYTKWWLWTAVGAVVVVGAVVAVGVAASGGTTRPGLDYPAVTF